jgi:YjbE family integral membrane protein
MELFSLEWFSALLSILVIDLVLAGDNAIVIGLAARRVPEKQQKLVIGLGTLGAIVIRILATLAVVWLLKIPGLYLIGGIVLLWISYNLLKGKKEHEIAAKNSVWAAIGTIIAADAAMGLDNVLAVAGAAHGSNGLVITGIAISIPIVVWGSTMIVRLTRRYPWMIFAGAAVLAYTAANMIVSEPSIRFLFDNPLAKWGVIVAVVTAVLWLGLRKKQMEGMHNELSGMSRSSDARG